MFPANLMHRLRRLGRYVLGALLLAGLDGCSALSYYAHVAQGEYEVLAKRQPITELLADPATDPKLRARLAQALQAREFASDHLDLPRNGSYTLYADIGRRYVVWNVFATPELSLKPVTHCFPIAGCVAYRGYYDEARAQAEAQRLSAQGDDTYVGGVTAYSTLGWFDDPILSSMLRWDNDELDGTIFHELAHQKLYVKNDTAFNESFANFVEQEGLRQWRAQRGQPPVDDTAAAHRSDQFTQLILDTRKRLEAVYASDMTEAQKRAAKQAEFEQLRSAYRSLRDTQWNGYAGYDKWMETGLNNAKLLPFGLYDQWVPAFAALYARRPGDWPAFYAAAKQLADEAKAMRQQQLQALLAGARS